MNRNKYTFLLGNTFIIALGNLGSKVISFFLVPLYTNYLTTSEFGTSDLIMTCSSIVVPIFSLVIYDAVLRFGISKEHNIGDVFLVAIVVFVVGSLLSVCLSPVLNMYDPLKEWKIYVLLLIITTIATNIMYTYLKAKEMFALYAITGIVHTLVLAITNILLIVVADWSIKGYLLSNVMANCIPLLLMIVKSKAVQDLLEASFNKALFLEMIRFSCPLIINNISWWILSSSDKVMIEHYLSASDLGLYVAASKIPALLYVITSIFSEAWTVSSIKEYDTEKDEKFYTNIFNYFTLLMFFGIGGILLILKPFMTVYVGQSFFESWMFVPFLLLGTLFYSFGSFFGSIYGALKKNISVTITTLIAAIINITMNYILIPRIGVLAACLSTAISYLVLGLLRMYGSQKYFKFYIDYKRYWINSVLVIIAAMLSTLDFHIVIVSICIIVLLCLVNINSIGGMVIWVKSIVVHKIIKRNT